VILQLEKGGGQPKKKKKTNLEKTWDQMGEQKEIKKKVHTIKSLQKKRGSFEVVKKTSWVASGGQEVKPCEVWA